MTDPPRWLDDDDAPHGAASLLRSARASKPIDAAVQARSAARVAELVAQGVTATTTTGAVTASLWTKVTVGLASIALVGGVAVGTRSSPARPAAPRSIVTRSVAPPPVVAAAHAPRVEASSPTPTVAPRTVAVAAPRPSAIRAPRVVDAPTPVEAEAPMPPIVSAPAPSVETSGAGSVGGGALGAAPLSPTTATLYEESVALAAVSTVIERDAAEARRRLAAYRERFPRSRLVPERDYLAFEVARRMGDDAEARALGEAFLRAHPRSPHASAVRARVSP